MKTLKVLLGLGAAVLIAGQAAQAVQIEGTITFTGTVGLYAPTPGTPTTDLSAAVGVETWDSVANPGFATVETADGDFLGLSGSAVTIAAPWAFTSGAIPSFWSVGGFTFDLTSSAINTQNALFIGVTGTGVIKHGSFMDTAGTWFFSTQGTANGDGEFSFSADSAAVPDSGATLALLGMGLIGLAGVSRRIKR